MSYGAIAWLQEHCTQVEEELLRLRQEHAEEFEANIRLGGLANNLRTGLNLFGQLPEGVRQKLVVPPQQVEVAQPAPPQVQAPTPEASLADSELVAGMVELFAEGQMQNTKALMNLLTGLQQLQGRFLNDEIRDGDLDLLCDEMDAWFDAELNDQLRGFRRRRENETQTLPWQLRSPRQLMDRFERVKEVFQEQRRQHLQSKVDNLARLVAEVQATLSETPRTDASQTPIQGELGSGDTTPSETKPPRPARTTERRSERRGEPDSEGGRPPRRTPRQQARFEPPPADGGEEEPEDPALTLGANATVKDDNGIHKGPEAKDALGKAIAGWVAPKEQHEPTEVSDQGSESSETGDPADPTSEVNAILGQIHAEQSGGEAPPNVF